MILTATHITTYLYGSPVPICHTQVHLTPRTCPHQRVVSHELEVRPEPAYQISRQDYFGNDFTYFCVHEPHQTLTVTALSQVDLHPAEPPHEGFTTPWEEVRRIVGSGPAATEDDEIFRALEFTYRSPFVRLGPE